ncbi:MAG: hypothetical protein A2Z75_01475 [Chloroflexi bacterium RBG_13_50_10]|nr:MAG: hypothetical protein A2Z75_01475 [Chloroflexi bacterium RBG_13_50_10]
MRTFFDRLRMSGRNNVSPFMKGRGFILRQALDDRKITKLLRCARHDREQFDKSTQIGLNVSVRLI